MLHRPHACVAPPAPSKGAAAALVLSPNLEHPAAVTRDRFDSLDGRRRATVLATFGSSAIEPSVKSDSVDLFDVPPLL